MASAGDDHGNAPSSATPVALPSTTDGRIDTHDDVDYFRFVVSDTQPVSIGTGGALDTLGTLYGGDGGRLESNDDDGPGRNFRIKRSLSAGTYYVGVASHDVHTGAYTLFFGVDDGHSDEFSSATPVALPSTTGGRIETPGDVDYFRFEVSDTQQVTIETSGNTDTDGVLTGRGLAPSSNDNGGSGSNFSIQSSLQAGTYYVRVASRGVGAYTLHLAFGDDHGDAPSEATLVALPDRRRGWIQTASDVDYFQFEISDPQRVSISTSWYWADIARRAQPPRPRIALYAGDGRLLESNDNGGFDSSIERSLSAGTYNIRVATNDGSTGRYFLSLRREVVSPVSPDDDYGNTLSSATWVALPSMTAGHINAIGDVDYFRFEVTRTQEVSIVASGAGNAIIEGFLLDSDGGVLERSVEAHYQPCGWGFGFQRSLSVGTYYVQVEANSRDTGAYTLHLALSRTVCGDDHGNTLSSATRVALPSTTGGQIQGFNVNDADYFRFEIAHEQRVSISVSSKSGIFSSLSNADGDLLVYLPYTDRGIRAISMRTLSADTYYVVVTGSSGIEAGAYTLRLEVEPLYGDELRLPLDALAPDAPGGLRWTAAYSSDESTARVRIEGGELAVEPVYAAEGSVRIEATATDGDGGTVATIFDVQVEFYWPRRAAAGWRSALFVR